MTSNSAFDPPRYSDLLDGQSLHCIPSIDQGETLYSWCARYHRISGSVSAITTSLRLFGSKTGGFVVDFPGRIGHFSEVTASILGGPEQLIKNHTLYPLYAAFRPQETMAMVQNLMLGSNVERVKFILGLPASRAATSHPLKFCPTCAHEELVTHGIAKWWRDHQWPSAWLCPRHQKSLHYIPSSRELHKVTSWITPDSLAGSTPVFIPEISEHALPNLERLTYLTSAIVKSGVLFQPEIMRIVFTLKLREYGWIRPDGTIDRPALQNAFLSKFCNLETLPGFDFVQGIRGNDFGSLGLMLRGSQRKQHPTKYILLIDFLFDTAEQFIETYIQHVDTENPGLYISQIKNIDTINLDSQIKNLVQAKGLSLNSAAKALGVSVQRVIGRAKKINIEYQKRPRKTNPQLKLDLDKLIHEGASRSVISKTLNVSRKWITTHLARNPDLKEKWLEASHSTENIYRRSKLLEILANNPGANQKTILSIPGNPFQWLKRNDKNWLRENLPFFGTRKDKK
jgi:transposase